MWSGVDGLPTILPGHSTSNGTKVTHVAELRPNAGDERGFPVEIPELDPMDDGVGPWPTLKCGRGAGSYLNEGTATELLTRQVSVRR